jgi:hypothetical protein
VALRTAAQIVDAAGCITEIEVKDISPTGAKIETAYATPIPRRFCLRVPRRNINQEVEVVWRDGTTAGVRFVQPEETPAATPAAAPATSQKRVSLTDLRKLGAKAR